MLGPAIAAAGDDVLHQRIGPLLIRLGVLKPVNSSSDARQLPRECAPLGKSQDAVFLDKLLRHHEAGDGDLDIMALDALCDRALCKNGVLDLRPCFAL